MSALASTWRLAIFIVRVFPAGASLFRYESVQLIAGGLGVGALVPKVWVCNDILAPSFPILPRSATYRRDPWLIGVCKHEPAKPFGLMFALWGQWLLFMLGGSLLENCCQKSRFHFSSKRASLPRGLSVGLRKHRLSYQLCATT